MKKIFIVLFLVSSLSTFAQSHKYDISCKLCKDCTIIEAGRGFYCPACVAEDKIEREKTLNKLNAEKAQAVEKYNKQLKDQETYIENQKREEEQRNSTASAKINNANSEIDALNKMEEQQSLNMKNIEDKYKLEFNKINSENDLFLKELRNSSKTTATNKNDPYWNETISPEKLFKFEIKDENRNSLYGYKNEKDSIKIKPKFSKAEEFVNGYAKVEINLKNDKYDGYDLVGPCSYYFRAYFVYIERGIIGKNGKLIKAGQKILIYNCVSNSKLCLTNTSNDYKYTQSELEAFKREREKEKLEEKTKAKREFDSMLENYLNRARNEGYIIEKSN